jgi:deazaflavin-dependent oxidoreductase (nitroreductase family)
MTDRRQLPKFVTRVSTPAALAMSGHRIMPLWATIHHTGRKSGRSFHTPIAVIPVHDPGLVMIGLPWGTDTNWARNVVAAGGANLTWKGRDVWLTDPRIVKGDALPEAVAQVKAPFAGVVRRMPGVLMLRLQE